MGWSFIWDLASEEGATLGLGIADAYQGRGLGTLLLEAVLQRTRDLGLARVRLTVVQDNWIAWRLYEKHGFERRGEYIGQDGLPYYRMVAEMSAFSAQEE